MVKLFSFILLTIFSYFFVENCAGITITPVSDKKLNFGYIPHWDAETQSLYVTNAANSLIRYDTVTKQVYEGTFTNASFKVDYFLPTTQGDNYFVASYGMDVYILEWDGLNSNVKIVRKIGTVDGTEGLTYANTAKIDPKNRLLVATWRYDRCNPDGNSPDGSVFLFHENSVAEPIINGCRYPSGLEWDTASSKMYYIDICKLNIMAFDWSEQNGTVGNPSIVYDFRKDFPITSDYAHYLPVGSNLNTNGNLMVAIFNESTVAEINPTTGELVSTITIPVETVTGAVYGGKDLDTLFVTTTTRKSNFYGKHLADSSSPDAGKIFMITGLGTKGYAGRRAQLN